MQVMSVTELKAQFSEVLATVRSGGREGKSSYEIGKAYFGKYGSGKGTLSQNHKKLLKQKLNEKFRSN